MEGVYAAWLALLLAGVFEIAWAYGLKHSDGFTHFWPTLGTVTAITASYILMGFSLKAIPFGPRTRSGPASASPAPPCWAFLRLASRPTSLACSAWGSS